MTNIKKTIDFIYELGQLKRLPHSGLYRIGVKDPDTVGQHVARACQIGYLLAFMEKVDPEKVVTMLAIHDNAETRIMDQDRIGARYIDKKAGEKRAFSEQVDGLDKKIADKFRKYFEEIEEGTTKEGRVAKDADWLELAFTARELVEIGYVGAQAWIDNVGKSLRTKSAKEMFAQAKKSSFNDWWKEYNKV